MPYESQAQAGYFHEHKAELERQGVNVDEWDRASKGKTLPERAMSKDKGTAGLTGKSEKKDAKPAAKKKDKGGKDLHMHIRPAKNGGHIVEHENRDEHGMPDGKRHEYALADTAALHDHIDEHYGGGPNSELEEEAEGQGVGEAGDEQDTDEQKAAPEASAGE